MNTSRKRIQRRTDSEWGITDEEIREQLWHDAYFEERALQIESQLRAALIVQAVAMAEKQFSTVH